MSDVGYFSSREEAKGIIASTQKKSGSDTLAAWEEQLDDVSSIQNPLHSWLGSLVPRPPCVYDLQCVILKQSALGSVWALGPTLLIGLHPTFALNFDEQD